MLLLVRRTASTLHPSICWWSVANLTSLASSIKYKLVGSELSGHSTTYPEESSTFVLARCSRIVEVETCSSACRSPASWLREAAAQNYGPVCRIDTCEVIVVTIPSINIRIIPERWRTNGGHTRGRLETPDPERAPGG